jgi:hypothetical protein
MNNEIEYVLQSIGVVGLMGLYVWFKVWMYKREYNNDTKDNKENENK